MLGVQVRVPKEKPFGGMQVKDAPNPKHKSPVQDIIYIIDMN